MYFLYFYSIQWWCVLYCCHLDCPWLDVSCCCRSCMHPPANNLVKGLLLIIYTHNHVSVWCALLYCCIVQYWRHSWCWGYWRTWKSKTCPQRKRLFLSCLHSKFPPRWLVKLPLKTQKPQGRTLKNVGLLWFVHYGMMHFMKKLPPILNFINMMVSTFCMSCLLDIFSYPCVHVRLCFWLVGFHLCPESLPNLPTM